MCESCWRAYGAPEIDNAKVGKLAALYNACGDFTIAHVVVDDMNYDDEDVQWCLDHANDPEHFFDDYTPGCAKHRAAVECLKYMLDCTIEERASAEAKRRGWGRWKRTDAPEPGPDKGFVAIGVQTTLGKPSGWAGADER